MKQTKVNSTYITRYCILRNPSNNTLFDILGIDQYNVMHESPFVQGLELERAMEVTQDWNQQIVEEGL